MAIVPDLQIEHMTNRTGDASRPELHIAGMRNFPKIRFMGSKFRLLPWIGSVLSDYTFESVLDAFSGSCAVSYYFKLMGKTVAANDFLNFSHLIARSIVENSTVCLSDLDMTKLTAKDNRRDDFIERTFGGVFFTVPELQFLDQVSWNLRKLRNPYKRALATSALVRSCVKRQPRGVFTISGNPARYDDGRRDLRLRLDEHFREQTVAYNRAVFDNGKNNRAFRGDVFEYDLKNGGTPDLVYFDPPYVPRSDDNDYIKRYHFIEGLSSYWKGLEILPETRVKKIPKVYTPFAYRKTAMDAFQELFEKYRDSKIALSYSSNGYPDLPILVDLLKRVKRRVEVYQRDHRYHFGTHAAVKRAQVVEYLIVGE